MEKYIDADRLPSIMIHSPSERMDKSLDYISGWNDGLYKAMADAPAADVAPVKHGRWLIGIGENGEAIGTYCSECGWSWERNIVAIQLNKIFSRIETPRCPYCGAKMDGEEND